MWKRAKEEVLLKLLHERSTAMIQIDMDMPENCFCCKLSFAGHCPVAGRPIQILNSNCVLKRPQWCPLKDVGPGASSVDPGAAQNNLMPAT
jgi:hypothetical protein